MGLDGRPGHRGGDSRCVANPTVLFLLSLCLWLLFACYPSEQQATKRPRRRFSSSEQRPLFREACSKREGLLFSLLRRREQRAKLLVTGTALCPPVPSAKQSFGRWDSNQRQRERRGEQRVRALQRGFAGPTPQLRRRKRGTEQQATKGPRRPAPAYEGLERSSWGVRAGFAGPTSL